MHFASKKVHKQSYPQTVPSCFMQTKITTVKPTDLSKIFTVFLHRGILRNTNQLYESSHSVTPAQQHRQN